MLDVVISMRNITKRFPGVIANDHVNFDLRRGEVHTLLGENGAGKTTLMNILYGLYQPDEGEIFVKGKKVRIKSPLDAIKLGIGMVHQHFTLAMPLTVIENIIMGLPSPREPWLLLEESAKRVKELASKYGFKIEPFAEVWQISVGEQQRVEILKALYRNVDILILDEPTAVLTPQETEELFGVLRKMKAEGKSIIFISHKLEEVMEISDRITVLRDGKVVNTVRKVDTNPMELARMMVGREVLFRIKKAKLKPGEVLLKLDGVKALNDRNLPALRGVSFEVREREILGIAGVSGNGQSELAEVIAGLREVKEGKVFICGRDLTNASPREVIEAGLAHIPEDRIEVGLIKDFTIAENLILESYYKPPFARGKFLNHREIINNALKLIKEYAIKTPSPRVPVRILSGGNLQKVVLARELSRCPKVIIAAQPTRGLDVGATEYIRQKLEEERRKGAAILLISEDLEEILTLSDRVAVMYEGEIMGIVPVEWAREHVDEIGLMMAGKRGEITA